jgi:hypothetical protein
VAGFTAYNQANGAQRLAIFAARLVLVFGVDRCGPGLVALLHARHRPAHRFLNCAVGLRIGLGMDSRHDRAGGSPVFVPNRFAKLLA